MGRDLCTLVDDLGALRATIRLLRVQETALRDAILAARPNGKITGEAYRLDLRRTESRRFKHRFLPEEILADPAYWTTVKSEVVRILPLAKQPAAPVPDDFDVIER